MFRTTILVVVLGTMSWMGAEARAQLLPPFFGGGTAYDPEVGVVESGALLDAQATVSADRKYVTITTGATQTKLLDLVQFPVVEVGFVGGVNPGGGNAGGAGNAGGGAAAGGAGTGRAGSGRSTSNGINTSPSAIANQNSILNREGMFLLVSRP